MPTNRNRSSFPNVIWKKAQYDGQCPKSSLFNKTSRKHLDIAYILITTFPDYVPMTIKINLNNLFQ